MINTDTQCFGCPNAYYEHENDKSYLVGCLNAPHRGMVIKNNGDNITCMVTEQGVVVYKSDVEYCPLWHH